MKPIHCVLMLSVLALAACSSQPVGDSDIFTPIGGPTNSASRPSGDPFQTQGIGRLPPEAVAQSSAATPPDDASFETMVTSAIEQSETPPGTTEATLETAVDTQPAQTAGVDPNADSINLSDSTQAEQKAQREVAARELQAARDQLVIVRPDASSVPAGQINIAEYARTTTNEVGQRLYQRPASRSAESSRSRCARFADADAAQRVFLQNDGPKKDRLNLDPDGDGFACKWSPGPFRSLNVPGQ